MLAPAMVAVGVASFVVGDVSIYEGQLRDRTESPAQRYRTSRPLLASLRAGDTARAPRCVARADERVRAVLLRAEALHVPGAPVVGLDGLLVGVVSIGALRSGKSDAAVRTLASTTYPTVENGAGLDDALTAMSDGDVSWLPVVESGRLIGVLSNRDVMSAYRRAAQALASPDTADMAPGATTEAHEQEPGEG